MDNATGSIRDWLTNSAFLRVIFISLVMLLLQIPITLISSQVLERQTTKQQAINDVTSKWGYAQEVYGPRLVVPYYKVSGWTTFDGEKKYNRTKHYASFLPETLGITAKVENETRYRGIFEVPLYQTQLTLSGKFNKPDFSNFGIDPKLILWEQAELLVGVSDARGIRQQAYTDWNQKKIPFEPGLGTSDNTSSGFHVLLKDPFNTDTFTYQIELALNGSQHLYLSPMGKNSNINIQANWPDPSFQGYKLPTKRNISEQGFSAQWDISSISRGYPQAWLHDNFNVSKLDDALVGVNFIAPVDSYRMTERSIKYVMLFLLFTFVTIWLIEVLVNVRVHLLQYLFVGLGMCLFYLLLLALSEHIEFIWAYIIASMAVITMTGMYSKAILKKRKHSFVVTVGITALYIYLYTLLQEQNYSLLFGSIGVFSALAAVMYITRNIDWHNLSKKSY